MKTRERGGGLSLGTGEDLDSVVGPRPDKKLPKRFVGKGGVPARDANQDVELIVGEGHPGRENRALHWDGTAADVPNVLRALTDSRCLKKEMFSGFSEPEQQWILRMAEGDANLQQILMNAIKFDRRESSKKDLEVKVKPRQRDGILFWQVGENASHGFYLGAKDGKYFRMSQNYMHELEAYDASEELFCALSSEEQAQVIDLVREAVLRLEDRVDGEGDEETETKPEHLGALVLSGEEKFGLRNKYLRMFVEQLGQVVGADGGERFPDQFSSWKESAEELLRGGARVTEVSADELFTLYVGHH